jgi:hypothetical protein
MPCTRSSMTRLCIMAHCKTKRHPHFSANSADLLSALSD